MHNLLVVLKREYLERVRTKSFLLSTIGLPLLMIVAMVLPQKLATMKRKTARHIVVAAYTQQLGDSVRRQLLADRARAGVKYNLEVITIAGDDNRKQLNDRVSQGGIDGYLWLSEADVAARKVTYAGRELSDFMDEAAIKVAVTYGCMEQRLLKFGVSGAEIGDLMKSVSVETVRLAGGKESKTSTLGGFFASFTMVMLLYTTLALYGVAVMRAIVDEKTSRVMEVLLSSCTSRDLMTGKILGVGAVGMTQILIWILLTVSVGLPMAAAGGLLKNVHISPAALAAFAVFFLLGYLLYSTIFAAVGATVNSEQEGQQLQVIAMMPLIIAIMLMMSVLREPNSPLAVWTSMIPFFAPIIMYLRISVQTPPLWQITVSVGLLAATVWVMIVLCGRIYRVGVLMYGKRPTLPEILKWVKYAG
jgi:ABC-2 type transport system permease protein